MAAIPLKLNSWLALVQCCVLVAICLLGTTPTAANGYKILVREAVPGCYHNGTIYGEGSLVPTMEPCLSCQCNNRTLICSLRVCHEQPVPPPRGCILIHHNHKCCPHLFCNRFHKRPLVSEADRKIVNFLDEFEHEQKIINEKYGDFLDGKNSLRRRSEEPDPLEEICVQNGTVYQSGSAMTTSSLCSYCYCINGKQKCVKPKCLLQAPAHCSPIYIEGSCCPLKYDCSGNGSAKNITMTTKKWNKHKQQSVSAESRNMTDSQMQKSCIENFKLYVEGEKLPKDDSSPCDICYCIRGKRKCTPKKCAPLIRNCMPIVPPGQCCPSGYNCNVQPREKSRQFDLFSLLFGGEENTTEITSVEVTTLPPFVPLISSSNPETTSEKSFFDVIRDGLNFVDANEDKIGGILGSPTNTTKPENQTELKDIYSDIDRDDEDVDTLGVSDDEESTDSYFDYEESEPMMVVTVKTESDQEDYEDDDEKELNLLKDMSSTTIKYVKLESTLYPSSTKVPIMKPISQEVVVPDKVPEFVKLNSETLAKIENIPVMASTTKAPEKMTTKPIQKEKTTESTTKPSTTTTTSKATTTVKEEVTTVKTIPTTITNPVESSDSNTESIFSAFFSGLAEILDKKFNETANQTTVPTTTIRTTLPHKLENEHKFDQTTIRFKPLSTITTTTQKPTTTTSKATTTQTTTTVRTTRKPQTTKQVIKTTTRKPTTLSPVTTKRVTDSTTLRTSTKLTTMSSTSKETTTRPPPTTTKVRTTTEKKTTVPLVDLFPTKETQTEKVHLLTPKPLSVPPITKPNQSILDSDYHYDYSEPTLPPSLPNLKIIPFLPTDAVKNDRKKPYDYYNVKPSSYPAITTEIYDRNKYLETPVFSQLNLGDKRIDYSNSYTNKDISHDILKKSDTIQHRGPYDGSNYPSITEPVPQDYDYLIEGYHKKNAYGEDNFDVDVNSYMSFKSGPIYKTNIGEIKAQTEASKVDVKTDLPIFSYDSLNRFSPPKETEGGFRPKEPSTYFDKYHSTKYIEISTETPPKKIGSFFDTIFTESPLHLNTLKDIRNHPESATSKLKIDPDTISITTAHPLGDYHSGNDLSEDALKKKIVEDILTDPVKHAENVESNDQFEPQLKEVPEDQDGFLGDFFGMLFKDEDKENIKDENPFKTKLESSKEVFSNMKIPPFKSISSSFESIHPAAYKKPIDKDQGSSNKGNGTAIKNILLDLLGEDKRDYSTSTTTTTTVRPTELNFPVHGIPYIASNLHMTPQAINPIRNNLDFLLNDFNKATPNYQILPDDPQIANTESYVVNPVDLDQLKKHHSESPAQIFTKPSTLSKNDLGLLKLAGCNIYGRMYRVGRIISELSGPCLECKCTEVGVHCTPLGC